MNRGKNKLGKIFIECKINQPIKHDLETMKVTSLELTDVGGIPHLKLDSINEQMNIICGENGVGKTNILDAIAVCFSELDQNNIKKRSGQERGLIHLEVNPPHSPVDIILDDFKPLDFTYISSQSFSEKKLYLLYLKTNRGINYKKVESIGADPDMTHRPRYNSSGINNDDIKDWFLNRILHSKHEKHLSETQLQNLELAKDCFSKLNKAFSYSRLDTANEIFLNTPTKEIYLEYLSSGFKSTIFILLGLIKEIDYRYEQNRIAAGDYEGIILIDEIELHLHPEWQGRICTILKEVFPKAQFFITTHSPHVVQTAGDNEVIALQRQNDQVVQRELPTSEYGYQGWTVEEILKDVMGMEETRTDEYHEAINDFSSAFKAQNKQRAQEAFNKLKKMLHHSNELKAIYQMQLDSLGE